MSVASRVLRASQWQMVALVSVAIGRVLVTAMLARLLAPEEFGVMAIGLALIELMMVIGEFGAGAAIARTGALSRVLVRHFLRRVLLLGGVVVIAGSGLLGWAWEWGTDAPRVAVVTASLAVGGVVMNVATTLQGVSEAALDFRRVAIVELAAFWGSALFVSVPLAFFGGGVWALVAGFGAQALFRALGHVGPARRLPLAGDTGFNTAAAARFGRRLTAARLLNAGVNQGDRITLGLVSTAASVGQYTRGILLSAQVSVAFGSAYDRVLYPLFARVQREAAARLPENFVRSLWMALLSLTPAGVLLSLESDRIIALLLGPGWASAAQVLRIAAIALPALAIVRVCDTLARAVGRPERSVRNKALHLLVLMVALAVLARGVVSTAAATAVAVVLVLPMYVSDAIRTAGGDLRDLASRARRGVVVWIAFAGAVAAAVASLRGLTAGISAPLALLVSAAGAGIAALAVTYVDGASRDGFVRWLLDPFLPHVPATVRRLVGAA